MIDLKYLSAIKATPGPYNDVEFTAEGDVATLEGVGRVKQDIAKILMTEQGLAPYPNYGTSLPLIPGSVSYSATLLGGISDEIVSAIKYLTHVEESEIPTEQISSIKTLEVTYSGSVVNVNMVVLTRSAEELLLGLTL